METRCAPRPSLNSSFPSTPISGVRTPEDETGFLNSWDADIKRSATTNARIANLMDGEEDDLAQETRIKLLGLCRGRKITVPNYVRTAIKNSMLRARSRIRGKFDRGGHRSPEPVRGCLPDGGVDPITGMQAEASGDCESEYGQREMACPVVSDGLLSTAEPLELMGVRRWVGQLPEHMRWIYSCIYVHGLSQREAARLLGLSQPRVAELNRLLIQRGRAELAC